MARRISQAKQRIKNSGIPFALPPESDRSGRLAVVLHVLYLIFTEGYVSTSGPTLLRRELSAEAIRLARLVHRLLPDDGEVAGLLALMLLTDARWPARTGPDGTLVPMAEQDRSRWDAAAIAEGVALISAVLPRGEPGPYQLQAAIAAIHDEAPSADQTDWPQILALYALLLQVSDGPMVHSATPSRRRWCTARGPAWTCSMRSTPMDGWPETTGRSPCARICWRRPETGPPHATPTWRRPGGAPARPSCATSMPVLPGSTTARPRWGRPRHPLVQPARASWPFGRSDSGEAAHLTGEVRLIGVAAAHGDLAQRDVRVDRAQCLLEAEDAL